MKEKKTSAKGGQAAADGGKIKAKKSIPVSNGGKAKAKAASPAMKDRKAKAKDSVPAKDGKAKVAGHAERAGTAMADDSPLVKQLQRENAELRLQLGELSDLRLKVLTLEDSQKALEDYEQYLNESETRYRLVTEIIEEGLGIVDEFENFVYVNQATCDILGYTFDELVGQSLSLVIPPEDMPRMKQETATRREGKSNKYQLKIIRKDGQERTIELKARPWKNDKGEFMGTISVVNDVTEKILLEKRLLETESLSKVVMETSPIGITIRERSGALIFYNEAWKLIWDYTDQEIKDDAGIQAGRPIITMLPYLKKHAQDIEELFDNGGDLYINELEIERPKPNGARWISQYIYALMSKANEVEKVVTLTQDISDRKEAEKRVWESEAVGLAFLRALPDPGFLMENNGTILASNQAMAEAFGVSLERIVGTNSYDYVFPQVARERKQIIGEVIRTGHPVKFYDERKGRQYDNLIFPVFDSEGKVTRIAVIARDITDKKNW